MEALLKAALSHRGTAVLDIISPCVSFNDHEDSTKSYAWGKAHEEIISEFNFIPCAPGDHGGVRGGRAGRRDDARRLADRASRSWTTTTIRRDRYAAMRLLEDAHQKQEFITGLIYIDENRPSLPELERLPETPLAQLPEERLRPSREALDKLLRGMM